MKKFVITGLTATKVGSLNEVKILSNGGDILVSGQNGAGKSTLKNAILWALTGRTNEGEKFINKKASGLPNVEVELYDGTAYTSIRREIFKKGAMTTVNCGICGSPVKQKDIEEFFTRYVPIELLKVLLNLGSFFKLKDMERREMLVKYFGDADDSRVILEDESLKELDTKGLSLEVHKRAMRDRRAKFLKELYTIEPQIKALESQLVKVEDDRAAVEEGIKNLETSLSEVQAEIKQAREEMQAVIKPREKLATLNDEYWRLRSEYQSCLEEIKSQEREIARLREEWSLVGEKCPTCGAKINREKTNQLRTQLAQKGVEVKAELKKTQQLLQEIKTKGAAVNKERAFLEEEFKEKPVDTTEMDVLYTRENNLREWIMTGKMHVKEVGQVISRNEKIKCKVQELITREKELGGMVVECEKQAALADKFILKKMDILTESINAQFAHVKFEMYETLKNGEVRNICEAQMDGVPYENLSKGEKLKAALDVLQAFQKVAGVMFPVLIDDAESYTSNSLTEVPNQKIMFRVVEGGALAIDVKPAQVEARKAAAV